MNIHQILSQGEGISLGPVTVETAYDINNKGKTPLRSLLVSDDSGRTMLKLWGPAASGNFAKGQSITIRAAGEKGGLKRDEYPPGSQKFQINANDCQIEHHGQASGGSGGTVYRGGGTATTSQGGNNTGMVLDEDQLIEFTVRYTVKALEAAEAAGLPPEVAKELAIRAPENAALWWFGKKFPGCEA